MFSELLYYNFTYIFSRFRDGGAAWLLTFFRGLLPENVQKDDLIFRNRPISSKGSYLVNDKLPTKKALL